MNSPPPCHRPRRGLSWPAFPPRSSSTSTARCSSSSRTQSSVRATRGLTLLLESISTSLDGAVALISGRPLGDIDRVFEPWQPFAAGGHGAEVRGSAGTRLHHPDAEQLAVDSAAPWKPVSLLSAAPGWRTRATASPCTTATPHNTKAPLSRSHEARQRTQAAHSRFSPASWCRNCAQPRSTRGSPSTS